MKYTIALIEKIQIKLRAMPTVEKREEEISRQESVKLLSKEIADMRKRGYTLEQISRCLNNEGLAVATPTLKSYLQKARSTSARGKKNPAPPAAPGDTPPRSAAAAPQAAPKPSKTKASFTAKADTSDI